MGRSRGLVVAGDRVQSSQEPTLIPSSAFSQLGDPGHVTYPLLSQPALSSTVSVPASRALVRRGARG